MTCFTAYFSTIATETSSQPKYKTELGSLFSAQGQQRNQRVSCLKKQTKEGKKELNKSPNKVNIPVIMLAKVEKG